jgi:hypothetical protein
LCGKLLFLQTIRKQARENNLLAGLLTSMIPSPISAFVVVPACMELGGFSTKNAGQTGLVDIRYFGRCADPVGHAYFPRVLINRTKGPLFSCI